MPDEDGRAPAAVVTGATGGAGKGTAEALGAAGATGHVTGRSRTDAESPHGGTGAATAELVDRAGGTGVAVPTDHGDDAAVAELFARARPSRSGWVAWHTERARACIESLPPGQRPTGKRESPQFTGRVTAALHRSPELMALSGRALIGAEPRAPRHLGHRRRPAPLAASHPRRPAGAASQPVAVTPKVPTFP